MTSTKAQLRTQLLSARRNVTEATHAAEANAIAVHIVTVVMPGQTVCAYVPIGAEPGSLAMLDALRDAGARVLLPVTRTADDDIPLPLSWGEYLPGELVAARFGLQEPAGPLLPADAIAQAEVVIVPALAVDRRGVRLGRGAGFYDRTLGLRRPDARLIAVVRDDELLEALPAEPHDVPMTDALTPLAGIVSF